MSIGGKHINQPYLPPSPPSPSLGPQQDKISRLLASQDFNKPYKLNEEASKKFEQHLQNLGTNQFGKTRPHDIAYKNILKSNDALNTKDQLRMQIARKMMNPRYGVDVKDVVNDLPREDIGTPIYQSYALQLQYLDPLLQTMQVRNQKLSLENSKIQNDLNRISNFLTLTLDENAQLRAHIVKKDKFEFGASLP